MPKGVHLRKVDVALSIIPRSILVTDCKSLFDALARSESQGLGLAEKRTAIEVAATCQQMEATGVECKCVNSDRELADSLTKPMAAHAMKQLCDSRSWKIIIDENFTAAKKIKRQVRDQFFKEKNEERKSSRPGNSSKDKKHKAQSIASGDRCRPPKEKFVVKEAETLQKISDILNKAKEVPAKTSYYNIGT